MERVTNISGNSNAIVKHVQSQGRYVTCHVLNIETIAITSQWSRDIETCTCSNANKHVKNYSPPTSNSNKNRHVVLVILVILVALHETIQPAEAKIRRRRCHSRSTTVPRPSCDCHVDPSSTCEYSAETFARGAERSDRPILVSRVDRDGSCTRTMNGISGGWMVREKQTGKLRGRSLAVDWRASAYPTPLITGRHPLHPTACQPLRRGSRAGAEPPAVILRRALIRASLRIAIARTVLPLR